MRVVQQRLTRSFQKFFNSEKSSGIVLIVCTAISLLVANSTGSADYQRFWQIDVFGMSLAHWINDGLMAIFFLLIGLELERELYVGELSNFKNALLPIFAAVGGIITPALIHFAFNAGTATQAGIGIPMATDIAFALGALALLGSRIPASLKVFVVAFAVIDDLCAIIVIATFYTAQLSLAHLIGALLVWGVLLALNRRWRVMALAPYLLGGTLMWFLMLKSGIHATVAGVMLAFAIPFSARSEDSQSPSHRLENLLHRPAAFVILPIFALANTAIEIGPHWLAELSSANGLGIRLGLVVGKPLGVTLFCFVAVIGGLCRLPSELGWRHIFGAGLLGGIGFTMSIFIANLAFPGNAQEINAAKMAILAASLSAGILGLLWLRLSVRDTTPAR
ncbi:MAG: Na+/H+ antiporter NhaA [Proteobacteria bacterium]|nr:Na+/H+ antiporter NhaA [Pseudomonadota bacterium]